MRRTVSLALTGLVALAAAGCSPDEGDFASEAESFIDDDDGDVAALTGLTFDDVTCEEPADTETGTTFTCSATASDGDSYTFTNTIMGENEFEIVDYVRVGGASTDAAVTTTTGG
jgi:hypothetical protein